MSNRSDTPWRSALGLCVDCRAEWRALYKPPLPKRAGDRRGRVTAVNAFITVLNPEISSDALFVCKEKQFFMIHKCIVVD